MSVGHFNAAVSQRGMTLIELLIAIAIASTLAVAGFRALSALTESASRLSQTAQRWQSVEAASDAVARAYRRAAPGGSFILANGALAISVIDDTGKMSVTQFPLATDDVRAWQFSAWENGQWVAAYQNTNPPAGMKLTMTTARGDVVERIYAR